jgi:hypothetical protein
MHSNNYSRDYSQNSSRGYSQKPVETGMITQPNFTRRGSNGNGSRRGSHVHDAGEIAKMKKALEKSQTYIQKLKDQQKAPVVGPAGGGGQAANAVACLPDTKTGDSVPNVKHKPNHNVYTGSHVMYETALCMSNAQTMAQRLRTSVVTPGKEDMRLEVMKSTVKDEAKKHAHGYYRDDGAGVTISLVDEKKDGGKQSDPMKKEEDSFIDGVKISTKYYEMYKELENKILNATTPRCIDVMNTATKGTSVMVFVNAGLFQAALNASEYKKSELQSVRNGVVVKCTIVDPDPKWSIPMMMPEHLFKKLSMLSAKHAKWPCDENGQKAAKFALERSKVNSIDANENMGDASKSDWYTVMNNPHYGPHAPYVKPDASEEVEDAETKTHEKKHEPPAAEWTEYTTQRVEEWRTMIGTKQADNSPNHTINNMLEILGDDDTHTWFKDMLHAYKYIQECHFVMLHTNELVENMSMVQFDLAVWMTSRPWAQMSGNGIFADEKKGGKKDESKEDDVDEKKDEKKEYTMFNPVNFMAIHTKLKEILQNTDAVVKINNQEMTTQFQGKAASEYKLLLEASLTHHVLNVITKKLMPFAKDLISHHTVGNRLRACEATNAMVYIYKNSGTDYSTSAHDGGKELPDFDSLMLVGRYYIDVYSGVLKPVPNAKRIGKVTNMFSASNISELMSRITDGMIKSTRGTLSKTQIKDHQKLRIPRDVNANTSHRPDTKFGGQKMDMKIAKQSGGRGRGGRSASRSRRSSNASRQPTTKPPPNARYLPSKQERQAKAAAHRVEEEKRAVTALAKKSKSATPAHNTSGGAPDGPAARGVNASDLSHLYF